MNSVWTALLSVMLLLVGCSKDSSAPREYSEKEKEIIAAARRAVSQFESWSDEAEYVLERRERVWRVSAWRIVHPEAKGKQRFVPWGVRVMTIDDGGKVIGYGTGK